jgi:Cu-processing system ATP-binding protein
MIVANNLRLEIDGTLILHDVSFRVARGESVALVGPNGSGKTSIIRCLLGLVPFSGSAMIHGHDVVRAPVAARTLVSYVSQKPAFGEARVGEVLIFVAQLRHLDRSRIADTLRTVGLESVASQSVRTLSGGMQQRLSLAVALLADTPVLLLDEPSASLDREGQETFFNVMQHLRKAGRTLLLASHRPEEVETLTDRVLHLDRGRLADTADASPQRAARVIAFGSRGGLR